MVASGFNIVRAAFSNGMAANRRPSWRLDPDNGLAVSVAEPGHRFCHDLPDEEGNHWVS